MPAVTFRTRGPLFRGKGKPITRKATKAAVFQLVKMGEQRLDEKELRMRPTGQYLTVAQAKKGQASTGHYRDNLHGAVRGLQGRIDDGGVIYGPWLEGTSSRNQTTRFKGYASFRRTGQWLQKQTKKVLRHHMTKAVKEMGG